MERNNKNFRIIMAQATFLLAVLIAVYILYPKTVVSVNGDRVRFSSMNAKVIMLSENPDFSSSRYLDVGQVNNISFVLSPGTYYYKASNGIISGFKREFIINSRVGLEMQAEENESALVNVGNVRINVTKDGGMMVGHIILEPGQEEKVEDNGRYTGKQDE